jgi:hypothetical protein
MAQEGIANCKKALSFVKQFLDKNGNLPSGTSEADLYDFVLEGMYKLEQANKQKKKASSAVAIDLDGSDDDAHRKPINPLMVHFGAKNPIIGVFIMGCSFFYLIFSFHYGVQ